MNKELKWLRSLYIEDLGKTVNYGGGPRPRVYKIEKYDRIEPMLALGVKDYMDIATTDKNVWVWSDLHFGHKNIISFSERPYANVDEMTEHLIANFNDYVKPDDVSIWVGDVAFLPDREANNILRRCNGYKILVIGNHDFNKKKLKELNFDETHLIMHTIIDEIDLVFTHYPMQNLFEPYFNIHGHLHGGPLAKPAADRQADNQHINVNCEFHGYKPINLTELIEMCKLRKPKMEMFKDD